MSAEAQAVDLPVSIASVFLVKLQWLLFQSKQSWEPESDEGSESSSDEDNAEAAAGDGDDDDGGDAEKPTPDVPEAETGVDPEPENDAAKPAEDASDAAENPDGDGAEERSGEDVENDLEGSVTEEDPPENLFGGDEEPANETDVVEKAAEESADVEESADADADDAVEADDAAEAVDAVEPPGDEQSVEEEEQDQLLLGEPDQDDVEDASANNRDIFVAAGTADDQVQPEPEASEVDHLLSEPTSESGVKEYKELTVENQLENIFNWKLFLNLRYKPELRFFVCFSPTTIYFDTFCSYEQILLYFLPFYKY